jgi:hypothetical protein
MTARLYSLNILDKLYGRELAEVKAGAELGSLPGGPAGLLVGRFFFGCTDLSEIAYKLQSKRFQIRNNYFLTI